jgi:hypothetical protein
MHRHIALGAALAIGALGCNDFSNLPLEQAHRAELSPLPAGPDRLDSVPGSLVISTGGIALPDARFGEPYAAHLFASGADDVCWKLAEGALPAGLELDSKTGVIGGRIRTADPGHVVIRVSASSPCDASGTPAALGVSEELVLVHGGRCAWDQDCVSGEICREDGTCREEIASGEVQPIGPILRMERVPAASPGDLLELQDALVLSNAFARGGSPCLVTDRELVLREGFRDEITICYQLPGEVEIPASPGERVDFVLYTDHYDARYAMMRGEDTPQGWRWAAHSGPLDGHVIAARVCGLHKDCPFVSQASTVLLGTDASDGSTACRTRPTGLRLKTQSRTVVPGHQAPWGVGTGGAPLHQLLLADGFVTEGCDWRTLAGSITYLLLEGGAPHPLLHLDRHEVVLEGIPHAIPISGGSSIASGENAGTNSYLDAFIWSVQQPLGNPVVGVLAGEETTYNLRAYRTGEYVVKLQVRDAKTQQLSRETASARVIVRPSAEVHIELAWSDPDADLNLHLLPPEAHGNWGQSGVLHEGEVPAWSQVMGGVVAGIVSEPDGARLEVLRVQAAGAQAGDYHIAVDQSAGATQSVSATVTTWVHGKRMEAGELTLEIGAQEFRPILRVDVQEGWLSAL